MSIKFTEAIGEVSREELSAELGEVSLHGDTRDCTRPHNIEKRNRGG